MKNRKKRNLLVYLFVLSACIGIGYAYLYTDLSINGTAKVNNAKWDIHFENLQLNENNVALSAGDKEASIDSIRDTMIAYRVTLNEPGDFYEFTVDAVNDSTIDGMIDFISNYPMDEDEEIFEYLKYEVNHVDGKELATKYLLKAGESESYRVRIEYRTDIGNLPENPQSISLSFGFEFVQKTEDAIDRSTLSPNQLMIGNETIELPVIDDSCKFLPDGFESTSDSSGLVNYGDHLKYELSVDTDEETGVSHTIIISLQRDDTVKFNGSNLSNYLENDYYGSVPPELIKNCIVDGWEAQQEP